MMDLIRHLPLNEFMADSQNTATQLLHSEHFHTYEEYLHYYYRWTRNWFECNWFCRVYVAVDFAGLIFHYYLNVKVL